MKQTILFLAIAFISAFATDANAQKFSEIDKSVHDVTYYRTERNAPPIVMIVYGRSLNKGREIFGSLLPFDKIWRTGANAATEINFFQDVNSGGKDVKAATYTLFTIPGMT